MLHAAVIIHLVANHRLTDDKLVFLGEVVFWDLKVERSRSLAYTSGDVVVGTVAGAEPATVVTSLTNGDTTQMGADTYHCLSVTIFVSK